MEKYFDEQEKGYIENIITKAANTFFGVCGIAGDPFKDGEFNKLLIRHNLTPGDVEPIIKRVRGKLEADQKKKEIEYKKARERR